MSINNGDRDGERGRSAGAWLPGREGADVWDRPQGDWGRGQWSSAELEQRRHANSCYRLGTLALRTGDLQLACNWLRRAIQDAHPGAAFRLAAALWRASGKDAAVEAVVVLISAARWGHTDARALLQRADWDLAGIGLAPHPDTGVQQDAEFCPDIEHLLGTARRQPTADVPPQHSAGQEATGAAARPGRELAAISAAQSATGILSRLVAPDPVTPSRTTDPLTTAPPGRSTLLGAGPLRQASLMHRAQQAGRSDLATRRWRSAQRVLEVLQIVADADQPVSERHLGQATSLSGPVLKRLLVWLGQQQLVTLSSDGGYVPGPTLTLMATARSRHHKAALAQVLAGLRDAVGAAVYIGVYRNGEVEIRNVADGPSTPRVQQGAPFHEAAHATALGKSLLAQLTFEQRMDHLTRREPIILTNRTITDRDALFHNLDRYGPHAVHFDLLEYSTAEVCVAVPIKIGTTIGCLALSLPFRHRHRLIQAAKILSSRSAGLLLTLLLATTPEHTGQEPFAGGRPGLTLPGRTPAAPGAPSAPATNHDVVHQETEDEAEVIPFPISPVALPVLDSPEVLFSTSFHLMPEAAGQR